MDARHISWFVECSGQYDYMLAMLSRNRTELDQQISELTSKFADYIAEYEILSIVGARKLEYKYLSDGPMPSAFTGKIQEEGSPAQIDDTDLKILERLDQDARTPIADIAAHADTTPNIVAHRIRRLKEKGIIQGFRTIIDTDKTGKEWHIILFKLTPSEKEVRKLPSFLREHPNCTHLVTGFGSWQLMADFHVDNTKELDGILEQIRDYYSDIIQSHTTLRIPKVHKTVFFPRK